MCVFILSNMFGFIIRKDNSTKLFNIFYFNHILLFSFYVNHNILEQM